MENRGFSVEINAHGMFFEHDSHAGLNPWVYVQENSAALGCYGVSGIKNLLVIHVNSKLEF